MASHSTLHPWKSPADPSERSRGIGGDTPVVSPPQKHQETAGLPAVLSRRHLIALTLLIILSIANTSGVQFGGPATFLYWTLGLLTFLVPCAFVTQWLAQRFPGQSAPFYRAAHMLGANWSFFSAFCVWWPVILEVVATIERGLILIQYLAPTWLSTPIQQCVAIVLLLGVTTGITCLPLRRLKHLLLVLAALYIFVFMLLGVAGGWWLMSGHPAATALNSAIQWRPTSNDFAVYGLIVLVFLGGDAPMFLGGELRDGKTAARRNSCYVWWGAALSFVAYLAGTFGVMVIVPPAQAGALGANIMALQLAFGPLVGNGVGGVLIFSQMLIPIIYLLVFSRLLVLVAQDRRLPAALARVNRHGVPILSIVVQAVVVACVTIVTFVAIPSLFSRVMPQADLANIAFNVLTAGTTVVWAFYFVLLFVFILWFFLRHKVQARVSARQRWLLLGMSMLGTVAAGIGMWSAIFNSAIPTLVSDESWAILVGIFILFSLVVAYIGGEVSLRTQLQVANKKQEELLADVNQLYREQAQAAVTDAITGLPNHRAVMSRIEEEVSRCQRTQRSCAVLFVDLDHFKHVNDTCGHQAGDAILREVGNRFRTTLRLEDFVGRYGGEEFTITLTETNLSEAYQTAERLRLAVASQPCVWQAEDDHPAVPIAVTASIGVAVYQVHGLTREELIESADRAMYQAKHTGRNRVCLIDEETGLAATKAMMTAATSEQSRERVGVQALTAAASAHDRGTSAHAQRMVRLAEATARLLGRPEEELHLIRLAALLHDIGKIGIPKTILSKPGPLTDEEWALMRQHPNIGRLILEQTGGIFHFLSHVVVAHHERWDGEGYPNRLAGEAIPMSARILAVVDSYDAMTTDRPYREAMSVAEARAELQRCVGRQYDPQVVEGFLCVLDEEERGGPEVIPTGTNRETPASAPTAAKEAGAVQRDEEPILG